MTLRTLMFAPLALFAAQDASALTTYCVSTAAELRNALTVTEANDDVEVRMRTGTYYTGGSRFLAYLRTHRTLKVSGGWGANCLIQARNPALSVLHGEHLSQVLDVFSGNDATTAHATFTNFSVEDGLVAQSTAAGMALTLNTGTPSVLIDRVRFSGNVHDGGHGGGLRIMNFTAATVVVRNSLVTFNGAQLGAGIMITSTQAGAVTQLVNNTVVGNQTTNPAAIAGGGVDVAHTSPSAGSIELRNNVVFGNTAGGVGSDIHAANNAVGLVGTNNATGVPATGKITQTGALVVADPGFFSAQDDFRLAEDSPLIDAGAPLSAADAASHDFAYAARVLGQAPDIGAYESDYAVFADSFE